MSLSALGLFACAMCARQVAAASRLAWIDLALLALPFSIVGLGAYVFRRAVRRSGGAGGPGPGGGRTR